MRKLILIKPDSSSVQLIGSNQIKYTAVLLTSLVHLFPAPCPSTVQMMLSLGPECQCSRLSFTYRSLLPMYLNINV